MAVLSGFLIRKSIIPMRHFFIIFSLLLAVVLQATVVSFLSVRGITPNLALVLIFIFVVLGGFERVWVYVLLTGLFLDLFSGLPFGLFSASLVAATYFINWLRSSISLELKFVGGTGMVVLGVFVFNLFLNILAALLHLEPVFNFDFLLWSALYNLLITILIFNGIKKIFYKTQP